MKNNGRHAVHRGNSRIVIGLYTGFGVGLRRGIRALKKKENYENAITILLDRIAAQINRMENPVPRASLPLGPAVVSQRGPEVYRDSE